MVRQDVDQERSGAATHVDYALVTSEIVPGRERLRCSRSGGFHAFGEDSLILRCEAAVVFLRRGTTCSNRRFQILPPPLAQPIPEAHHRPKIRRRAAGQKRSCYGAVQI